MAKGAAAGVKLNKILSQRPAEASKEKIYHTHIPIAVAKRPEDGQVPHLPLAWTRVDGQNSLFPRIPAHAKSTDAAARPLAGLGL